MNFERYQVFSLERDFIIRILAVIFMAVFCPLSLAFAQDESIFAEGNRYVQASLLTDRNVLEFSRDEKLPIARVGILLKIEPGWHLYWKNSGEAAIPTTVEWKLPPGWSTGELRWPAPTKFIERGDVITFGYERETLLIADIHQPAEIPSAPDPVKIGAVVSWLVCKDICVPGERRLDLDLSIGTGQALAATESGEIFAKYEKLVPRQLLSTTTGPQLQASSAEPGSVGSVLVSVPVKEVSGDAAEAYSKGIQVFPGPSADLLISAKARFTSLGPPVQLLVPVTIPKQLAPGGYPVSVTVAVEPSLTQNAVEDLFEISGELNVAPGATDAVPPALQLSPHYREVSHTGISQEPVEQPLGGQGLLLTLLAAFVAGAILNLMPCVLPVISLKIMGFIEHKHSPRSVSIRNALSFVAGIIFSFIVLGIVVVSLRRFGQEVGWGFQFQHPEFVLILLIVVYALSLAFFDIYEVNLPGMRRFDKAVSGVETISFRHFFDGILATALSTPCTAPFLGSALAVALTQSAYVTMLVFISIGLGLGAPYLLIAANPRFLAFLPAPGPWMSRFRQLMGFFLLGTAIWLLSVLQSLNPNALIPALIILFGIQGGFWLYEALLDLDVLQKWKEAIKAGILILFVVLVKLEWNNIVTAEVESGDLWRPYSQVELDEQLSRGSPVFIDFTASWCITCKFNERFVLASSDVRSEFDKRGVVLLKADWTKKDPEITHALTMYGGTGVPHYVLISGKGVPAKVLPTLLTKQTVIDALHGVELKQ